MGRGERALNRDIEQELTLRLERASDLSERAKRANDAAQHELKAELAAMFGTLTLAECSARFSECGCCFAPILSLRRAVDSPHYRERGLVREESTGIQALFPAIVDGQAPALREPLQDRTPRH